MPNVQQGVWALVSLSGALVLALVATNGGFYNHDELDLLHALASGVGFDATSFTDGSRLFYRPLGYAAFRAQLQLAGGVPVVVHTLSTVHHLGNVALLALLLRRLGLSGRPALLALLLPTVVPGVAWVAAIYDRLLWTWLLAVAIFLTARGVRSLLGIPCLLLALATKETAVAAVVPALLLAWRRRRDVDRCWVIACVSGIVLLTTLFVLWRRTAGAEHPDYVLDLSPGAVVRVLRLSAFPFAVGAMDPHQVWGFRWLAALGSIAMIAMAWRGSRSWTLVGLACSTAPLAVFAVMSHAEGHGLYLATPGVVLLTAAALRWHTIAARVVLGALLATTTVQAVQLTAFYRRAGLALENLRQAHTGATGLDRFAIVCLPGALRASAERFVLHGRHCRLLPPPYLVEDPAPLAFVLTADADVRQLPAR